MPFVHPLACFWCLRPFDDGTTMPRPAERIAELRTRLLVPDGVALPRLCDNCFDDAVGSRIVVTGEIEDDRPPSQGLLSLTCFG